MRWRVEVARRLLTCVEVGPGARIAVLAPSSREIRALSEVLPGAVGFRLSDLGLVGDGATAPALVPLAADGSRGGRQRPAAGPGSNALSGGLAGRAVLPQASLDVVVAWLVMTRLSRAARRRLLDALRGTLRVGGTLLVVDHNRPRTCWLRAGNVGWCLLGGVEPFVRPAYPVAREVKDADFERVSLRIALRERVQIVRATRVPPASHGSPWTYGN